MASDMDALTRRFDAAWFSMLHQLGPQLVTHAHVGLTPGQVFMLYYIRRESRCTVSKLAGKMEVAASAITVMLDRLENHGFVVRTRDQTDRRVVIIQLTDTGEKQLNRVLDARKQIVQHCLEQIDSEELNAFVHTLEKLADIARVMDINAILGF